MNDKVLNHKEAAKFEQCPTCREYGWVGRHTCPPLFRIRPDDKGHTDDDYREVYAFDYEQAVERWAERWDSDGDYNIVRGTPARVVIWNATDGVRKTYDVDGETVAAYHAREVEEQPGG